MSTAAYYDRLLTKEKPNTTVNNLRKLPVKDKGINIPHYEYGEPNEMHQADTLFLANDKGYQYLLVVVDVGTRMIDAEPMKGTTSKETAAALKKIYSRKGNASILEVPKILSTDQGSEFKGEVKKYMDEINVYMKTARTKRHRQVALVERKNRDIGTLVQTHIADDEARTGQASSAWVSDIRHIIKAINKKTKAMSDKYSVKREREADRLPRATGPSTKLLSVGTKVRVQLDSPKEGDKFRAADERWDRTVRTIQFVLLKPNQPPMYQVSGIENAHYTYNQLQQVSNTEVEPLRRMQTRAQDEYEIQVVQKIKERRGTAGNYEYLIKWKDIRQPTWEKRVNLEEDIGHLLNNFDKTVDKNK